MDYNNFWKLRRTVIALNQALILSLAANQNNPEKDKVESIIQISLLLQVLLCFSKLEQHTKDVKEVRGLYNEFIKDYNELNKTFNFKNPIEVYTLFEYLLKNGYLSREKIFMPSTVNIRDIYTITGSIPFIGTGVCRHISTMLKDILNEYGMETYSLGCTYNRVIDKVFLSEKPFNYDDLKQSLNRLLAKKYISSKKYEEIIHSAESLELEAHSNVKITRQEKNLIGLTFGNHAICFTEHENKHYFLDATQSRIYTRDKNLLLEDDCFVRPKNFSSFWLNNVKDTLKMIKLIKSPKDSITEEEQRLLIEKTEKLCKQNTDIFEHFYKEHSNLYEEASDKMLNMKKPMI